MNFFGFFVIMVYGIIVLVMLGLFIGLLMIVVLVGYLWMIGMDMGSVVE